MSFGKIGHRFRLRIALAAICVLGHHQGAYAQVAPADKHDPAFAATASARQMAVRDLPLAGGAYQRVLFYGPKTAMRGIIVMFPGGADDIGIERNGDLRHDDNFVVRTRELWAQRGYGVVIVDAIGRQSMRGQRSTDAYAAVIQEILAFAHSLSDVPVWVMGTSQGSIAAMSAASHAQPGQLAGVVLTESVSILGQSHETVFDAHPADVRVPALVVANGDDACRVAPPSMAGEIVRAMRHAPTTVLLERGGTANSSNTCSSLSPHGYFGIEEKVVNDIDNWMRGVKPASPEAS